ncbi:MAG: cation transporting ATPase C-terminal domain-containing protein [Pyrinomonadaceae bacterium]|nr:cation transporting ATPase C-terminal domain-containing protein [Pyrinomonadaceae bacterium]
MAQYRPTGLDTEEISQRLSEYGPNRLPKGKKQGAVHAGPAAVQQHPSLRPAGSRLRQADARPLARCRNLLGVVVINGILGFIQEGRAEKALESIRNMLCADARTVRVGQTRVIPAEELVPGYIVLRESGDKVPIGQIFYLLNSRYLLDSSLSIKAHLENKYLPLSIGGVLLLQLLFTYARPLQVLFDNEAIPLNVWPWLFLGGLVFFLVIEMGKLIIRSVTLLRSAVTAVEAGT